MKLYHYIHKNNNALSKGVLSFAQNPNANRSYYYERSGGETTHEGICRWMESCFIGRSRGIRAFTEPIRWAEHNRQCLKCFIDDCDCFAIDITALTRDGLVEAVYVSPSVFDQPPINTGHNFDELLLKLNGVQDIDYSPLDWEICDDAKGWRFAYVRYYLIVVKGGIIPPKYIALEKSL